LGRPQVSFAKRQREQARREKQQLKAEKKAERKNDPTEDEFEAPVRETAIDDEIAIP
jgi:hypothetical protein